MSDITQLIHRICEEAFNQMNTDLIDELYAPDCVLHGPVFPDGCSARDITKTIIHTWKRGMPDRVFAVEDVVDGSDRVAVRWTCVGTHTGVLHGAPGTGRRIRVTGLTIAHLREGKVTAVWQQWDTYAWFKALGVSPVDLVL